MAQIRYLVVLSVMALTPVEKLTCYPSPWNLSQYPDNPPLPVTAPRRVNNYQSTQQVKGNQSRTSMLLSTTPSKDAHDQPRDQVRESRSSNSDSVLTAPSLDMNDPNIEQGIGTQSRKSTFRSTHFSNRDKSQIGKTLSNDSNSVLIIQNKDTMGQAREKVRTIWTSHPAPASTTKHNSQAHNNDINATGLGTHGQTINFPPFPCPSTCQCEIRQHGNNDTIRDCEKDPTQVLDHTFDLYAFPNEVNIVNAKLATFPCSLVQRMSYKLITLRLWRNDIKTVSCNLTENTQLRFLDMAWNKLETIAIDILHTKLDTLLLNHNNIREVPTLTYERAQSVDLSHNLIKDMPSQQAPSRVLDLNLSHNLFESIPCNLLALGSLQTLDLGYNAIREVSPCTNSLFGNLQKLVLTHNKVTELSDHSILHFINELDMSYNAIVSVSCMPPLPISPLTVLDMSHNVITEVACNLSSSQLMEFNLAYNLLDTMPCNLSFMAYLIMLSLNHNSLKSGGCNLSELPLLSRLDLSNNYLTAIPFDPFTMPRLSHVDLSWNQLVKVPSTLLIMPRLQNLKVSNNALKTLSRVPSLQWLDLSHNSIQHVSADCLLSLSNVTEIYLDNNRLQRLPDDIVRVKLGPNTQLHLSGNPWVCDCEGLTTIDWIVANYKSIQDPLMIQCNSPNVAKGRPIVTTDRNIFCPDNSIQKMYTTICVLIGVVILLLVCFPLVCVIRIRNMVEVHERKAWEPINWDEAEGEGKEFDVFVSYANEDEEYVGEYLIPELEARGFKVCFHRVHFLGGKSIIDNICECIAKSKKMLAFYSRNYIKSNFAMYEFNMAMDLDAQNATTRLITIKDTDVDIQNLRITHLTYFRTHSYIIRKEPRFWENLVYTLPQNHLGTIVDTDGEG